MGILEKSEGKKGSSNRKNKEAITANSGVIFAYSKCICYWRCACTSIYPVPHFSTSPESCSWWFYSFMLETRYVHGKPAELKVFTSQEGEMQFLTGAFFNTQKLPGPATRHWRPACSCRYRWGPSTPPMQMVIWATRVLDLRCLILSFGLFFGGSRILSLGNVEY